MTSLKSRRPSCTMPPFRKGRRADPHGLRVGRHPRPCNRSRPPADQEEREPRERARQWRLRYDEPAATSVSPAAGRLYLPASSVPGGHRREAVPAESSWGARAGRRHGRGGASCPRRPPPRAARHRVLDSPSRHSPNRRFPFSVPPFRDRSNASCFADFGWGMKNRDLEPSIWRIGELES